jgi:DNA-binding MarR family transcriptional regulator
MKISLVKKNMPGSGVQRSRRSPFWGAVGPRLLEPVSLQIIQALVRQGGPLSLRDLATQLGLESEAVLERVDPMEKEGVLTRVPTRTTEQLVYYLGEPSGTR